MDKSSVVRAALPATQERSRLTRDRLLDAAEHLLSTAGLDAATAPRIAKRAGVAVGSLYKRFPDKDAVLRLVYERFFERSRERNLRSLSPDAFRDHDAASIVTALVHGMVRGYVKQRRLLHALVVFADTHADPAFRRQAEAMRRDTFQAIGELLLTRRAEIGHPTPEQALELVLWVLGATLKELVLKERSPLAPDLLAGELTSIVQRYLMIAPPLGKDGVR